ncbi:hypothetical protein AB0C29_09060 [Actinoplanes sp. NPDC048791]|uniref:hypothetical protein n=1 Tax=Actinoplanes sp. NPDC048791 TaxID=3154623 RepID=UPI0034007744
MLILNLIFILFQTDPGVSDAPQIPSAAGYQTSLVWVGAGIVGVLLLIVLLLLWPAVHGNGTQAKRANNIIQQVLDLFKEAIKAWSNRGGGPGGGSAGQRSDSAGGDENGGGL